LASYDHAKPVVIDPVLLYSTYLGGNDSDGAIAVDPGLHDGSTWTHPASGTRGPPINGGGDGFDETQRRGLALRTYLGGQCDFGSGTDVDAPARYVTGFTRSRDGQLCGKRGADAFVTKLNAAVEPALQHLSRRQRW
jgi:hypothetical protein